MSFRKKVLISLTVVLLLCYLWSLLAPIDMEERKYSHVYYTEVHQEQGNWGRLRHWQFDLGNGYHYLPAAIGPRDEYRPWIQSLSLEELEMVRIGSGYQQLSSEELEDIFLQVSSLTLHVYYKHVITEDRAKGGFLIWDKSPSTSIYLTLLLDTGSEVYMALDSPLMYQNRRLQSVLVEMAENRRKFLIPVGVHLSILWVALVYMILFGITVLPEWRRQIPAVEVVDKERIDDGPILTGNWRNLKDGVVGLKRYKYTSPPLKEILDGSGFRHGIKVRSYIIKRRRVKEVRTGAAIWARAKATEVSLVLVAEGDFQRISSEEILVHESKDAEFEDEQSLRARAARRQQLLPIGLRWR